MFTINFHGRHQVEIATGRYCDNDQLYVCLEQHGELFAGVSVCFPGISLKPDEFIFKTYGENTGLFQAMIDAERVVMVNLIDTPMDFLPVCRLSESFDVSPDC